MKKNGNGNWGMNWIRQEKRLAIYLRDGMGCCYCGLGLEEGAQLTLDHLRSRHRGGSNEASNLVTACSICNSRKGDRPVKAFCREVAEENHGVRAEEIERHVRNQSRRGITKELRLAKDLLEKRVAARMV